MALTYAGDLSTDLDRVRFHINDTTTGGGPRPASGNFTDAELSAIIDDAGTWQRAVAALLDHLSVEWSQHADITVGPRSQSFSQVADAYAKRAEKWRKDNRIYPGVHVVGVIRKDGYSNDVASDDVDTDGEYAHVTIRTWEYPL